MARQTFFTVAVVKDDERAILTHDGKFVRILGPGRHRFFDLNARYSIAVHKAVRAEVPWDVYTVIAAADARAAADNFTVVQTQGGEAALVAFDGQPAHLLGPWQSRAYWSAVTKVAFERIDTKASLRIESKDQPRITVFPATLYVSAVVEAHETGLLFADGELRETLKPGRHVFWNVDKTTRVQKLDMRSQALEITAQEILTKDRVSLRVTLTAFWCVVDPVKAVSSTTDVTQALYKITQFAIREAVATRTLDDILAARDRLDIELREFVRERTGALGIELEELGVKDVILPGEVRELINKVVEAERVAKANLIRRQEETAATRSLLNTAKLMEDNKLLLRLKELEALEKLVEKVGRIDLHATGQGQGLEAILRSLFRFDAEAKV